MVKTDERRTLSTVETTCQVLDAIEESNGTTVTGLAEELGLSPGGVYNHLATLNKMEFVTKRNGKYYLSLKFLTKGRSVRDTNLLYKAGKNVTERLADETREFSHLMACEFGWGIYLQKSRGDRGISQDYNEMKLGTRDYLHWSSSGKAYLAFLPESEVRAIVERNGLPSMNKHTITDLDELLNELAEIRDQGYAINNQEEILGTRAIGAPVQTDNQLWGAISISGPKSRFTFEKLHDEFSQHVLEAANIISVNIETIRNQ
jgi:DNA-binding IclR family transcriptional regulator